MIVWYCANCHKTYGTPFIVKCGCGCRWLIPWPSDLPLPTQANVRGLVAERDALKDLLAARGQLNAAARVIAEMKGECGE